MLRGALRVAAAVLVIPGSAEAQGRIEITPQVGWQWGGGGSFNTDQGVADAQIDGAVAYGLIADFEVRRGAFVEAVLWTQPTKAQVRRGSDQVSVDVSSWYFHIGGMYEALNSGTAKPFALLTLGATQMNPKESGLGSEWFFSFALGGGVKVFFSERVALRAQARAWISALSGSSGFYCGFPGGCGVSTWVGRTSTQGEISGGLTIAVR